MDSTCPDCLLDLAGIDYYYYWSPPIAGPCNCSCRASTAAGPEVDSSVDPEVEVGVADEN